MKNPKSTETKNIKAPNKVEEAAVLLLTFNRADNTKQVLLKLREARIKKLYVSNDGPRANNANDIKARKEIKSLLDELIDWPCELFINFQENNLGCGACVAAAITWAFEQEERLIILEDDCVPALSYFDYCNNLLELYKDDTRVSMISGNNYNEEYELHSSYIFSRSAMHIWGWATWKRCWKQNESDMNSYPAFVAVNGFKSLFSSKIERAFWKKRYATIYSNRKVAFKTTWDYQFIYSIFKNGGLCIVPEKNLVTNIGYEGTHNTEKGSQHDRKVDTLYKVESHPPFILVNNGYDLHHVKNHWMRKKPILKRIKNKVTKVVKSL